MLLYVGDINRLCSAYGNTHRPKCTDFTTAITQHYTHTLTPRFPGQVILVTGFDRTQNHRNTCIMCPVRSRLFLPSQLSAITILHFRKIFPRCHTGGAHAGFERRLLQLMSLLTGYVMFLPTSACWLHGNHQPILMTPPLGLSLHTSES